MNALRRPAARPGASAPSRTTPQTSTTQEGLYPADLPASRNPDLIDNIFNNRGVLWAARLLLVSAAAAGLRESLKRYEELFEELEHLR